MPLPLPDEELGRMEGSSRGAMTSKRRGAMATGSSGRVKCRDDEPAMNDVAPVAAAWLALSTRIMMRLKQMPTTMTICIKTLDYGDLGQMTQNTYHVRDWVYRVASSNLAHERRNDSKCVKQTGLENDENDLTQLRARASDACHVWRASLVVASDIHDNQPCTGVEYQNRVPSRRLANTYQ